MSDDPFGDALTSQSQDVSNPDPFGAALDNHAASASDTKPSRSYLAGTPLGHFAAVGENVLSGITSGAGSLADAVTMSQPGAHDWTYQPRTTEGKALQQATSKLTAPLNSIAANTGGELVDLWGGNGQAAADTLRERIPEALGAIGTVAGVGGLARGITERSAAAIPVNPQDVADAAVSRTAQGAPVPVDVSKLKPETQQALGEAKSVDPDALRRIAKAESVVLHRKTENSSRPALRKPE